MDLRGVGGAIGGRHRVGIVEGRRVDTEASGVIGRERDRRRAGVDQEANPVTVDVRVGPVVAIGRLDDRGGGGRRRGLVVNATAAVAGGGGAGRSPSITLASNTAPTAAAAATAANLIIGTPEPSPKRLCVDPLRGGRWRPVYLGGVVNG